MSLRDPERAKLDRFIRAVVYGNHSASPTNYVTYDKDGNFLASGLGHTNSQGALIFGRIVTDVTRVTEVPRKVAKRYIG